MKRRELLKTGLGTGIALGAGMSLPSRVFAQPMAGSPLDRQLFAIAKRELDKAGDVIWRKDIVGVLGQGLGWFIYIRNLALIYGSGSDEQVDVNVDPDPEPTLQDERR